jgi:hypothetical protein
MKQLARLLQASSTGVSYFPAGGTAGSYITLRIQAPEIMVQFIATSISEKVPPPATSCVCLTCNPFRPGRPPVLSFQYKMAYSSLDLHHFLPQELKPAGRCSPG